MTIAYSARKTLGASDSGSISTLATTRSAGGGGDSRPVTAGAATESGEAESRGISTDRRRGAGGYVGVGRACSTERDGNRRGAAAQGGATDEHAAAATTTADVRATTAAATDEEVVHRGVEDHGRRPGERDVITHLGDRATDTKRRPADVQRAGTERGAVVDTNRTRRDRAAAGKSIRPRERERARAGLRERAGSVDDARKDGRTAQGETQCRTGGDGDRTRASQARRRDGQITGRGRQRCGDDHVGGRSQGDGSG